MNISTLSISMLAAAFATPAIAQEAMPTLPPINTQVIRYLVDCRERALPSQRQVGEWTGQSNFGQVYDTRERLMQQVGRSCQRDGVERVQLVMQDARDAVSPSLVAINATPAH